MATSGDFGAGILVWGHRQSPDPDGKFTARRHPPPPTGTRPDTRPHASTREFARTAAT